MMLANSARCASQALGVTLGKLEVAAAADVVITDYIPSTPLTTENLVGHFLHGMGVQNVRQMSLLVDGYAVACATAWCKPATKQPSAPSLNPSPPTSGSGWNRFPPETPRLTPPPISQ